MATLSVHEIAESGLEPTYAAAAAAGDTFANDSSKRTFLHVKNGGGVSTTVSVALASDSKVVPGYGEMSKTAASAVIGAGDDAFVGPFPVEAYGQAPEIGYTETASVTIAAMRV